MASEKKFGKGAVEMRFDQPLATKAVAIQLRLARLFGGAMGDLTGVLAAKKAAKAAGENSAEKAKADAAANAAAVEMLQGLLEKADPDAVVALMGDMIAMAEIKGPSGDWSQADMDDCFSGPNAKWLLPVVAWIAQEMFGDFFAGLREAGGLLGVTKTTG